MLQCCGLCLVWLGLLIFVVIIIIIIIIIIITVLFYFLDIKYLHSYQNQLGKAAIHRKTKSVFLSCSGKET